MPFLSQFRIHIPFFQFTLFQQPHYKHFPKTSANKFLTIIIKSNTMQEGTVKFFNESKGFGFITPDDGSKDVFVHASGLQDEISENDKVVYDVQEGKKGPNAVNVRLA